jgi:hypothetical protein
MNLRNIYHLALWLLILPQIVWAQQLKGTYCFGNGYEITYITFREDSKFSYYYAGCIGGEEGNGAYAFSDSFLVLAFKQEDTVRSPFVLSVDSATSGADSVHWLFKVADETGEYLPGATIQAAEYEAKTLTDLDGNALMVLPKNVDKTRIDVLYPGFPSKVYSVVLSLDHDYVVTLTTKDELYHQAISTGTIYQFTVRNIRLNSLELKRQYKGARFETYRKVRRKKS